jgi:hypothetical protein
MHRALCVASLLVACHSPVDEHTVVIDPTSKTLPLAIIDETTNPVFSAGAGLSAFHDALDWVEGIGELADGRIALPEPYRFRLFDTTGTETWRYGKQGMGPTEFLGLTASCGFRGDTIAAMDFRHNRFVFIVPTVGVVATEPDDSFAMGSAACSGDGSLLVTRTTLDSATRMETIELWVRGGPGSTATHLATRVMQSDRVMGGAPISVGFVDTLIFVSYPNRGEIELLTRQGHVVRRLAWGAERTKLTDSMIRAGYDRFPYDSVAQKERAIRRALAGPRLEHLPPFRKVTPGGPGRLWLWYLRPPIADSSRILVVTTEGEMLGEVRIPDFRPDLDRHHRFVMGVVPSGLAFGYDDTMSVRRVTVVAWPWGVQ